MELKLRLFILLFSFLIISPNFLLESKKNYISYKLNRLSAQETKEEGYIFQVVNKKGDILLMASEKYNSTHYLRMLIIYEYKTSSFIKRINYLSNFNLC